MSEIKTLSIDIETYSDIDLSKCGVYKYTESTAFGILLFGYSVNGGEVQVVDLACGDSILAEIIAALTDETVTKWAFNASFERICLSAWLRRYYLQDFYSYSIEEDTVRHYLDPESWKCSMIWSAYMGLPLSLAGVGAVLGLEELTSMMNLLTNAVRAFPYLWYVSRWAGLRHGLRDCFFGQMGMKTCSIKKIKNMGVRLFRILRL